MKYIGNKTKEISFPIGGIGSGCIGLAGNGRLIDWEIFNRPAKGTFNSYSHIAVKAITKDDVKVKVLNGDFSGPPHGQFSRKNNGGYGFGPDSKTMAAFPHFKHTEFIGEFPIAEMTFKDDNFPANIRLKAFNPFIPLDAKNSSIPAAFFELEIENTSKESYEFQTAFTVKNPYEQGRNTVIKKDNKTMIFMENTHDAKDTPEYGDLTLITDAENTVTQSYWYKGRWMDSIVTFWREFKSREDLHERIYDPLKENGGDQHCTLVVKENICVGEKKTVRFILSWNVPNCYNYWRNQENEDAKKRTWKNYYATVFEDSRASANYSLDNWNDLYKKTKNFKDRLFASTLDESVIDAISSTISVLKSPTVLRLEDGSFYGWEGLNETSGSCEGTCQHVWNYAYALCFLFPELEKSIRNLEFKYELEEDGKTNFRMGLPLGENKWEFRACLDGQMGTVIKAYREWKISGDDDWLRNNWKNIKSMLEYAWSDKNPDKWDLDKDGVLEGRQHHTLDMELFGPSSWLESMYLAALLAGEQMALFMGDDDSARLYRDLFEKGKKWTKENLFNGEYFIQKVDLKDKEMLKNYYNTDEYWNYEKEEIKHQIGEGSEIDQLLGQWHADLNGLGEIFDKDQFNKALESMMKYNYKDSVREFENCWRVFSLNDEAGTVICEYPNNVYKPFIPIPYSTETMHGFEYQFAATLIMHGKIADGLKVVKAVRDKYDGEKRNPWNEMECGSNYARSMASYSLLVAFSGFEFDLPNNYIGFNPVEKNDSFNYFWSLGTGWGSVVKNGNTVTIDIAEGSLTLESIGLRFAKSVKKLIIDGNEIDFSFADGIISFEKIKARKTITAKL